MNYPVLRKGDRGDFVGELQSALGLKATKTFDNATDHAVRSFQVEANLVVDGIVGPRTWSAVLKTRIEAANINPRSALLGSQRIDIDALITSIPYPEVREAAQSSIPLILQQCGDSGVTDLKQIAYILATAEHESHLGRWMEEFASGWDYEGREDLGNTQPGDGPLFKGRGFVQLTGRTNYDDWSKRINLNLVEDPTLVTEPAIAAKILVEGMKLGTFTGYKLSDFIGDNFRSARRIINGMDCAERIAAIAQGYLDVLEKPNATKN